MQWMASSRTKGGGCCFRSFTQVQQKLCRVVSGQCHGNSDNLLKCMIEGKHLIPEPKFPVVGSPLVHVDGNGAVTICSPLPTVAANRRLYVLFVHQSSELYGSDKVLLLLVTQLQHRGFIHPVVVLPGPGLLLDRLVAAGIEVHVADVVKVSRAGFTPLGLLRSLSSMRRVLAALDTVVAGRHITLVHSNTLAVMAGALWSWRRRVPHLWHVHEIVLTPGFVSRIYPWLVRLLADHVVANSDQTAQWMLGYQPKLAARCHIVFNGLPPAPPPEPARYRLFRSGLGIEATDLLVSLVGRLNSWKGQGLLIEAAALLRRQGRLGCIHIALVGDPPAGQEHWGSTLVAAAKRLGVADRIHFIPFVEDIDVVWGGTDIAVVPSTEPEPFGMVAVEAMHVGVPVVAAAHGGLLNIVQHGVNGLLFKPRDPVALADAIARLADDPTWRRSLGAAGRLHQQQQFSLERQVLAVERIYLSIAARMAPEG